MAPNKRGVVKNDSAVLDDPPPYDYASSVITKEEIEARGSGTKEAGDTYDRKRWLWSERRVFFTGLMFLTRLPVPASIDHHPAFLVRSTMWFPLIGALVGAWGAAWFNAAALLWPATPMLAAALSTLSTVWLCGCFHEDGLADTVDGFGGGWGKEQILRIMKDSRVGTYALVGTALALQVKLSVLGALGATKACAALVAAHTAARWTALPLIYCCTYLQDSEDAKRGLYNWMAASKRLLTPARLAFGTASTAAVLLSLLPLAQVAAVAYVVLFITVASAYYGHLVIGGVVGDFLGATICVTEIAIYCVLAADWAAVAQRWQPLAVLAAVAALPVMYTRRVIAVGGSTPKC